MPANSTLASTKVILGEIHLEKSIINALKDDEDEGH